MKNETLHKTSLGNASRIKRILLFCCFLLGFFLSGSPQSNAQITGPGTICSGVATPFGLIGTPNLAYTYTWTVTPPGDATILTSSGSGSTVQWLTTTPATSTITVIITRPSLPNITWTKTVNVVPEPNPQITTNTIVGCQGVEGGRKEDDPKASSAPGGVKGTIIDDGACIKVCQRSTVQYDVAGGQPGSTYQWSVDAAKGTITGYPSGSAVTVYWSNVIGFTFIKVKETTSAGCVKEKTICIQIIESPDTKFSVNGTTLSADEYEAGKCLQACIQEVIQFSDLTPPSLSSPLVAWQWDFGDGTFSSLQYPQHTYNSPGNYTVTLKVTNQCGCVGIYKVCIEVSQPDKVPVQIQCPSVVCENTIGHYTIQNDCDAMTWTVNGGTIISSTSTSVDIQWNNVGPSGFGEIIADFTNCGGKCSPKVTAQVPVIQTNGTIIGKASVCYGKQYKYQLPKWPATNFKWSVSPAGSAVIVGYDQNSYEVNIVAYAPFTLHCDYINTLVLCSGKADKNINVVYPMTLNAPAKTCLGTSTSIVTTSPSSSGTTYTFIDPNGNTSYSGVFDVIGVWTVQAVNPGFCEIDPISIAVVDRPAAVSSISGEAQVCLNTNYVYDAISPMPNTICTWSIVGGTFTGSNTGNSVIVKWTSSTTKTLSVTRSYVDPSGCTSAATSLSVTLAIPTGYVSGNTTPCANTTANYSVTLTGVPVDNVSWSISPASAGSISAGQNTMNPTITWNNASAASTPCTIIATLTKCGSSATVSYNVSVIGIPSVIVTPSNANPCSGDLVNFSMVTTPSGATVTWTTSGAPTATPSSGGTPANIVFTNLGNSVQNATVLATVSMPGCLLTGQGSATVAVKPQPNINVSPGSGTSSTILTCNPVSIPLVLSTNASTTINWYRNGGSITPSQVAPATSTGTYRVDVTNSFGCLSSVTRVIAIDPLCGATPCTLPAGAGASSNAAITSCANSAGQAVANVNFTSIYGSYLGGGSGMNILSLAVSGNSAYCTLPAVTVGVPTIPVTGILVSKPGIYPITLRIGYETSPGVACYKFVTQNLTVPVISDFDFTTNCGSSAYTLTLNEQSPILSGYSTTTNPGGVPAWTINGATVTTPSSVNLSAYTPGSTLTVVHTITVTNGTTYTCTRTKTYVVPVVPNPAFSITTTDPLGPGTSSCARREVIFTSLNNSGVTRWNWSFGDMTGYVSTTLPGTATRTYANPSANPSSIPVSLTLNDAFGCSFTKNGSFNLYQNTLAASAYVLPEDIKCQGTASSISLTPSGGFGSYSYAWFREEAALGLGGNPISVTQNGLYWTRITDARGCQLNANPTPAKRAFQPLPDVAIFGEHDYCPNQAIKLNGINGGTTGFTYQWQQLIGASWTNIAGATLGILDMPSGLSTGVYQYRVIVNQSLPSPYTGSCPAVSPSFTVTVHGLPNYPAIAGPSVLDCADYSLQLDIASPQAGVIYNWSNGTAGYSTVINHGGPYRVWATNIWGCKNKADIDIPLEPSAYFWRFPHGCYTFCPEQLPRRIDGPSYIPFAGWEWMINGGGLPFPNGPWASAGSYTTVDPLNINLDPSMGGNGNGSGDYQWMLDNGLCKQVSDPMSITITDKCCRADAKWVYFNCVRKHDGTSSYYGGLQVYGGLDCKNMSYTIYALDPVTGLPNGTVTPSAGVYTSGSTINFSYVPFAGVNDVQFKVVISCDGRECIATPEVIKDLKKIPCSDIMECDIMREWMYFNCYWPKGAAAPYFSAGLYVSNPFGCSATAYILSAVDPVTGLVNGTITPSSGTIPPGVSPIYGIYHPNAGVSAVRILITMICDGRVCTTILGEFYGLDDRSKYDCKDSAPAELSKKTTEQVQGNLATMLIAPNPANSNVKISYTIPDWKEGDNSQIAIVNLLGQPVAKYTVTASTGVWQYATQQMIPGTYLVRLIKEGRTIDVQNMIIVH